MEERVETDEKEGREDRTAGTCFKILRVRCRGIPAPEDRERAASALIYILSVLERFRVIRGNIASDSEA